MALGHDLEPFVIIYIDDILIMGNSVEEVIERMKEVAKRLKAANLAINLAKCKFLFEEVKFLGYRIGHGEVKADPEKVQTMINYPRPKSLREVRQFLGRVGYY